jgi:hypothetical protein
MTLFFLSLLLTSPPLLSAQSTTPTSRPVDPKKIQVSSLSHLALDQIDQRRFRDAERTLKEAIDLDPENATCLFNLACVHAAMRKPAVALEDLKRATSAGFTDFSHVENNPIFIDVRATPGYAELVARKAEITHAAGQRIVAELRKAFGDRYLYDVDEKRKFVFAAHTSKTVLQSLEKTIHEEAASLGDLVFAHPSDEFIRIVMATGADFAKIENRPGVGGYYDDSARMLLVHRPGFELRHEFVHALHAADQHALGEAHPIWLSEGLATLYETPRRDPANPTKLLPNDTWRLATVQSAARRGTLIPLEDLLKMKRDAFTNRADLAYGEAGSLLMYLHEHEMLKGFYAAYTERFEQDPTGRTALEHITGKTLPDLQTDWVEWLSSRPVPPRPRVDQ